MRWRRLAGALVTSLLVTVLLPPTITAGEEGVDPAWQALLSGRHEHAEQEFARRLADAPGDLRSAIGFASIQLARGATDTAARDLLRAVETDRSGLLGAGALVRSMSLAADLRDGGQIARPLLEGVVDGSLDVPDPELRSMAALALADTLVRAGQPDQSRRLLLETAGRIDTWSMLGPYGKFEGLGLTQSFPPEEGDLDPSDDPRAGPQPPPHRIDTRFADGRVQIPDGLERSGVFYAVTDLIVEEPLTARIRVSGRPSMRVFVDGALALELDRMRQRPPAARTLVADLQPGRHRLLIKIVPRPGMSPVGVTVLGEDGTSLGSALRTEHPRGRVESSARVKTAALPLDDEARAAIASDDPARMAAGVWWLLTRSLARDLGRGLKRAHERWPEAAIIELWLGEYYMKAETGAAPEEDLAAARGHLESALAAAPDLARAHGLLAEMEWGARHLDRAWEHLDDGLRQAPDQPDLLLLRHKIARTRGWTVEAADLIERALRVAPGRTDLLEEARRFYEERGGVARLQPLQEERARRYIPADEPPEPLVAAGDLDRAIAAWEQVVASDPSDSYGWVGLVRALIEAERHQDALETLERARDQFPASGWIDRLRAAALAWREDRSTQVEAALTAALEADPSQLGLRETLERRGKPDPLSRWLVDPQTILEQAAPPDHPMDSALLADIAVTLVDERGGQTELYQGIHKVYTRAGVEQEGELEVLGGARIERIRIHKADGRVVDVPPGGKRPISLPGLEPGDAFEYVWKRYTPPLQQVPGALNNDTLFLFQGEDRDYVLSRFVVIHDESLPVKACVNSQGVDFEEDRVDGWRIRSWTARSMPRIQPEPHVADRFEATPHVRLGYGLSWTDVGNAIRDGLIGKLRPAPPLPELAERIRREAKGDAPEALARALHQLVNRELDPGRRSLDLGAAASVAASAGEGNRLGVALALAKLLELEPALVLARPIEMAQRDFECPTTFGFPYAMLRLSVGGSHAYLDYNGADHAFDAIPLRIAGSSALAVPLEPTQPVELIELPEREPGLLQDQRADVSLNADGRLSGTLSIRLEGQLAATTRRVFTGIPQDRMSQIEQGIASQVFPGARVGSFEVTGLDDPDSPLRIDLTFEAGSLARRTPSGFALPITPHPLGLFEEFGSLPSRRFAMLFSAQTLRRDRLNVRFSEGLKLASAPEPVSIDNRFGSYELRARVEDDTLILERIAKIPPQRIEPEDYPEFRSMVRTIDQAEAAEIRLAVESPALAP